MDQRVPSERITETPVSCCCLSSVARLFLSTILGSLPLRGACQIMDNPLLEGIASFKRLAEYAWPDA